MKAPAILLIASALAMAVTAGLAGSCSQACDFDERCNADTRELCNRNSSDVGTEVTSIPCGGENPRCVQLSDQRTICAADPVMSCDPDKHEATCDGEVALRCSGVVGNHVVVGSDCSAQGGTCTVEDEGAICVAGDGGGGNGGAGGQGGDGAGGRGGMGGGGQGGDGGA